MDVYGLKIIYRITAGSRIFYEESVVRLAAESFDDAYQKAEAYARNVCDSGYVNMYGDEVRTELVDIVDCFRAFEEENGVQEVYSRTLQNRTPMKEDEFFGLLTDGCTVEEMLPLRNREFNGGLIPENEE